MISLNFLVDPDYLAAYTLQRSDCKNDAKGTEFRNAAWAINRELYWMTARHSPLTLADALKDSEKRKFLDAVKELPYFSILLAETKAHLDECKEQWKTNLPRTKPIVERLMGREISGKWGVYMVHPTAPGGRNVYNNTIVWGHYEHFPNYHTVYLWHEALHSLFGKTDLEHSIIELITDEELRTKLNSGFYPPFVGHRKLTRIKKRILHVWRAYVRNPSSVEHLMKIIKRKQTQT